MYANTVWLLAVRATALVFIAYAGFLAYNIRLYAVKEYGRVIHEFDPWFNFRATQYLADNGWDAFFSWFDHRSWYPLGRPVGTTIYPGMQIVSVWIWKALNNFGVDMSLNDVCVFVPAWFGISATVFTGLIAYECSGSYSAAAITSVIMSTIPAHIMRSVAGGFDNEAVALTCMTLTFYCWVRSIRTPEKNVFVSSDDTQNEKSKAKSNEEAKVKIWNGEATWNSYFWGTMCGLSYIAMVATWGGFIFVLNLIAAHAGFLALFGHYSSLLHRAYSLFYIIGTFGAVRVPVVGLGPLKSLEQLSALIVFVGFQVLEYCEVQRRRKNLSLFQVFQLRVKLFSPLVLLAAIISAQLFAVGYFSPLTSRVRALFVKHTRTGNPLVDSVAEHQPASEHSYKQYLHSIYDLAQVGFLLSAADTLFLFLLPHVSKNAKIVENEPMYNKRSRRHAASFVVFYGMVAYFFANKMSRLILLLGPVASVLGGCALGFLTDQLFIYPVCNFLTLSAYEADDKSDSNENDEVSEKSEPESEKGKKLRKSRSSKLSKSGKKLNGENVGSDYILAGPLKVYERLLRVYNSYFASLIRIGLFTYVVVFIVPGRYKEFFDYCDSMAQRMSHPSIMFKAQLTNGRTIIVDDYREAYWWLKDNTPDDARVLSWWDYGYQIAGIANRTTLADGNTWNHEHIATIGRILTAPPEDAHNIARHLADYVLVWTGGGGDDLAKSPHMARIGNSVYPGLCPGDPTCSHFGFYSREPLMPTPSMENSLLYKLSTYKLKDGVELDSKLFELAFESRFKKVRIFKINNISQASKNWIADMKNKLCDRVGSWYCPGQYPPALTKFIASRRDFKQIEDFNVAKDEESKKYQEEYFRNMEGRAKRERNESDSPVRMVGCYGSEKVFPNDKQYVGGQSGSSAALAAKYAQENNFNYMALARVRSDGYSFFFNEKPKSKKLFKDEGCKMKCIDSDLPCGCADDSCGKLLPAKGEKHLRRWVVYEVNKNA